MKKSNKNIITTTGLEIKTAFIKNSLSKDVKNKIWVKFLFQLACRVGKIDSYVEIQTKAWKIWEFGKLKDLKTQSQITMCMLY